ncbi:hypothetical protein D0869_08270 [Hortaea werneckii]|uniref:Yeast cell wall synthesis Kre9/Knh1-like N-terminal domain-containing protein n=1 Tax=Hortaea werneckii TaxID=91943 RepID=A0A3M6WLS4_HORWE|nr:hypothetical protein KC324_g12827 [Hortaea werneckii]KAI7551099.1 hypothetical protein KC331_g2760 [Hortaea werneckii]KAI7721386.1 hypothetical protein KC353_g1388 [Hortaea werneckii]RMX79494.1 hypothetical protein D0869_08270 [Hortaea werneckii]RMX97719.1 hypothetical protein D0868_10495 [Hortaea werneckii]
MFAKAIVLAGLSALAAAQSTTLTFTDVPQTVTDGQEQTIRYTTDDNSTAVTILLRKGPSENLQTVSTLTTSATGGEYLWTPSICLENGDDYALEIQQGSENNYFGPFTVQGRDASCEDSASASPSANATASMTMGMNGTATHMPVPIGTAPAVGGSNGTMMATGTSVPRNTTMSMATLTPTTSSTGSPSSNSASATSGSSTSSGSEASATNAANEVQMSSAFALFLGAAAAAFYL